MQLRNAKLSIFPHKFALSHHFGHVTVLPLRYNMAVCVYLSVMSRAYAVSEHHVVFAQERQRVIRFLGMSESGVSDILLAVDVDYFGVTLGHHFGK